MGIFDVERTTGDLSAESFLNGQIRSESGIQGELSMVSVLEGDILTNAGVAGTLAPAEEIYGEVTIPEVIGGAYYNGEYEVTPTVVGKSLPTEGLLMRRNVTVLEIPYYETSNEAGTTVYIAEEV